MNKQKTAFNLNLLTSAKALIVLRVIIITIFLGAVIVLQSWMEKNYPIIPITMIIVVTYLLTICYSISLRFTKRLRMFCYIQIIGDLLIETTVIFTTGGIESVFSFLYILSIISASITLAKPGNYIAASLASMFYGTIAYFEFFKIAHPISLYYQPIHEGYYFIYKVFLNIAAFFIVAYLSGYLGEKWRTAGIELEEKSENLIELRTFHENIVKSMSSGLVTTDLYDRITSFNKAARDITGFKKPSEVIGTSLYSFLKFLNRENFKDIGSEKTTFRTEGYFKRKDGKYIYIGMSISPLKDEKDNTNGLIITFQDLTSMKEMEEKVARAERFAAIGQISAGIAHEIRNPLASMSGSIQVLKDELRLDDSNRQLMDIVLKETDRLNSIITQFLNYASPSPVRLKPCDINELIKETITLLKNSNDYHHRVEIITAFQEKMIVNVDTEQIKQVFINLCLNSFHAMPEGGNLILSSYYCNNKMIKKDNEKQYIKINFTDDGCGMSEDAIDKVFDPFYTTRDNGTGLGLAVVYRIVEKHQGIIDINSREGKGTSIDIMLPIQDIL